MAFNKKKKRRITVNGQLFYWSATGGDNGIGLMIMSEVEGSGKVSASFGYHQIETIVTHGESQYTRLTTQFVITPYIVRQVIQLALKDSWKPLQKGKDLHLGSIDDKIDLRLDQNRATQ